MHLTAGQNIALQSVQGVRVSLTWAARPGAEADLSALLLRKGKVISSEHFVFYNQSASPDGAVVHIGKHGQGDMVTDSIDVGLERLQLDVEVIVLAASAHPAAPGAMARLGEPEVTVLDPHGAVLAQHRLSTLTNETAVNVVELYRRDGQWKVRAVGQGWSDGLAGLARDYGVEVDGDDEAPESPGPAAGEGAEVSAPGIDWSDPPVPAGYEI